MPNPTPAVFLSYASQDAEAAAGIADALRASGVEVWFDQAELVGGDAWDAKIRRQIQSCTLFVPLISANTQARAEGYFRLEWHLAEQRTYLMAHDQPFLFPVVIDGTTDAEARVPEKFRERQWMRLGAKHTPEAIARRLAAVLGGEVEPARSAPTTPLRAAGDPARPAQSKARWLRFALPAGLIALSAALWPVFRPSNQAEPEPATPSPPAEVSTSLPVSPLVARAIDILNGSALTPEQIETSNQLLEQAIAQDPNDAEAWKQAARADRMMIHPYGYDQSDERRQRAMQRATRALNLAPDIFQIQLIHRTVMAHAAGNPAITQEAEAWLRDQIAQRPDNNELKVQYADVLREQQRFAEAAEQFTQIENWELAAWSWYQDSNYPRAYETVSRAVDTASTDSAIVLKILIETVWYQDLSAATATAELFRPSDLLREGAAVSVAQLAFNRHNPEIILRTLNGLSRDMLDSNAFRGPRQYYTGWAYRMSDLPERAAIEWRKAVSLLQAARAEAPDDGGMMLLEAEIQALLGETAAAESLLALEQRISGREPGTLNRQISEILLALRRTEEVLAWLESGLRTPAEWSTNLHANARFSPTWNPLRGDPRFEALLRETAPADAKPFDDAIAAEPEIPAKSIAVLAFENMSADADNAYFSDGISEELLNVLAKVTGLKVTARTSAFHFKGKDTPIPEIARQLGVAYVVEGSVRKAGDRVRITAQLIKADDGFHVWSDTFDRDLRDIFAVQDEIAGLIAQQLQLKLGVTKPDRVVDPEAYELVLKGRHFWSLRGEANLAIAEEAFRRALEINANFAEAHAGMADVWMIRAWYRTMDEGGGPEVREDLERAAAEVERATALDPRLAEPYATLGAARFIQGRFDEVEAPFAKAFELNPNYAVAHHWYAVYCQAVGRYDVSMDEITLATRLDPLAPIPLWTLASNLNYIGAANEAFDVAVRGLQLRPGFLPLLAEKATAAWNSGRRDEAIAAARAIAADHSDAPRWMADADAVFVLRQSGHPDEAQQLAKRVFTTVPAQDYRRAFTLAVLGRMDEALDLGADFPSTSLSYIFARPIWDPVREDQRFRSMLEEQGISEIYREGRATLERMRRQVNAGQ